MAIEIHVLTRSLATILGIGGLLVASSYVRSPPSAQAASAANFEFSHTHADHSQDAELGALQITER